MVRSKRLVVVNTRSRLAGLNEASPPDPRQSRCAGKVVLVVLNYLTCVWAADDLERLESPIFVSVSMIDKSNVNVVSRTDVQREAWCDLPVVLEIRGELFSLRRGD